MTATAAARAAVDPRPARGTAGRRAVQVVLFLGGLLALGLLAGGSAEARERPDPGRLSVSVADAASEGADTGAAARTAVEPPARRVSARDTGPVTRQVVQPVAEQIDPAARQQAVQQRAVQKAPAEPGVESAAELTAEPAVPADALASAASTASAAPTTSTASLAPTASTPARVRDAVVVGAGDTVDRGAGVVRPLAPPLPGLPPLFSVLPLPGGPGGEADVPGAPSPSVPDSGRDAGTESATPGDAGADASAEPTAGHVRSMGTPGSASVVPDGSGAPHAGHAQGSEPMPAPGRAPFGPCGDLARTTVADIQGPRGGDLHAVRSPGGPHTALVRGAGLPATAAPVPGRSGEILEFPG
ncbi:hypothetical protein ACIQWZ_04225 [Streptomyces sp. NPDC098077]|uniref:hypothetical protein n=1 Tax=Streptomyces sp. NPDC098077 TaxID=3366093 RepID=UPI00382C33F1